MPIRGLNIYIYVCMYMCIYIYMYLGIVSLRVAWRSTIRFPGVGGGGDGCIRQPNGKHTRSTAPAQHWIHAWEW